MTRTPRPAASMGTMTNALMPAARYTDERANASSSTNTPDYDDDYSGASSANGHNDERANASTNGYTEHADASSSSSNTHECDDEDAGASSTNGYNDECANASSSTNARWAAMPTLRTFLSAPCWQLYYICLALSYT
jgi:hypothetical protein